MIRSWTSLYCGQREVLCSSILLGPVRSSPKEVKGSPIVSCRTICNFARRCGPGVAALRPMFVQYAAEYGRPGDLSWLFLVGMDYHYGPFSSRNMMKKIRIRDLSGRKLALDGGLLHYDDLGLPADRVSDTCRAVVGIFPSLGQPSILKAFVLEKDEHYIYTDVHRAILQAHSERFGTTPFAVIGELWMGEKARSSTASWKRAPI